MQNNPENRRSVWQSKLLFYQCDRTWRNLDYFLSFCYQAASSCASGFLEWIIMLLETQTTGAAWWLPAGDDTVEVQVVDLLKFHHCLSPDGIWTLQCRQSNPHHLLVTKGIKSANSEEWIKRKGTVCEKVLYHLLLSNCKIQMLFLEHCNGTIVTQLIEGTENSLHWLPCADPLGQCREGSAWALCSAALASRKQRQHRGANWRSCIDTEGGASVLQAERHYSAKAGLKTTGIRLSWICFHCFCYKVFIEIHGNQQVPYISWNYGWDGSVSSSTSYQSSGSRRTALLHASFSNLWVTGTVTWTISTAFCPPISENKHSSLITVERQNSVSQLFQLDCGVNEHRIGFNGANEQMASGWKQTCHKACLSLFGSS